MNKIKIGRQDPDNFNQFIELTEEEIREMARENAMAGREIQIGDVVQIDPRLHPKFAACFAIVEEVRNWGVIAYVPIPDKEAGTIAPVRLEWKDCAPIGVAVWTEALE